MKLSRAVVLTAALFPLVVAGTALAQSEESSIYSRSGPYIQGGLVEAWSEFEPSGGSSRAGYDLVLGSRFSQYFAAELAYEGIPNWKIRGDDTMTHAIMADAKGYFPLGRIQPFLISGLGTFITQVGRRYVDRFGYRLGAGVDVFVTDSLYLSLSYRYTGNLDDAGYTNLAYGIGYHFD